MIKIIGLDQREYILKNDSKKIPCSKLQQSAYELIKSKYPTSIIWTEIKLPGSKTNRNSTLYIDFMLPIERLAFEIQGEQHDKFSSFFHGTRTKFIAQQHRDRIKLQWCELNQFKLIYLRKEDLDGREKGR